MNTASIKYYGNIVPVNSGDNQHFTLPPGVPAPSPAASLKLYLTGQLATGFVLSGTSITFASPLAGTINLRAFFRANDTTTGIFFDNITPTPLGDNRTFFLPTGPSPALSLELFNNGQLLQPIVTPGGPGDFTLAANKITFKSPLAGTINLQAWFRVGGPNIFVDDASTTSGTIVNLGNNQNFTLPVAPNPPSSLELYVNGQLETGFLLSGLNVNFASPIAGVFNLQAFFRAGSNAIAIQEIPRDDFISMDAFDANWEHDAEPIPYEYTISITQQLQLFLAHAPKDVGSLDLTYVAVSALLTGTGTPLNTPDDLVWGLVASVMADALSAPGDAYSPELAEVLENRYKECVELTKALLAAPSAADAEMI